MTNRLTNRAVQTVRQTPVITRFLAINGYGSYCNPVDYFGLGGGGGGHV